MPTPMQTPSCSMVCDLCVDPSSYDGATRALRPDGTWTGLGRYGYSSVDHQHHQGYEIGSSNSNSNSNSNNYGNDREEEYEISICSCDDDVGVSSHSSFPPSPSSRPLSMRPPIQTRHESPGTISDSNNTSGRVVNI